MEYALFQLITTAIEEGITISKIGEEIRFELLKDYAEEDIALYEDIEAWPDILFWDTDFLFLDDMTEEELINHPMADPMGIGGYEKLIILDGKPTTGRAGLGNRKEKDRRSVKGRSVPLFKSGIFGSTYHISHSQ